jgi:arginase family enzyme
VYVAVDVDVFEPGEVHPFMPEPGGLAIDEAEQLLTQSARARRSSAPA